MRRQVGAMTLLVASLFALAGVGAQGEKRVTMELKDAPIADAFDQLFRAAGENFILLPGVPTTQRLTMRLTDVPFEKALNFLCDLAALKWERKDGVYLIGTRPAGYLLFADRAAEGTKAGHTLRILRLADVPFGAVRTDKVAVMCTKCRRMVTRPCPQCRRQMAFDWQFCPFDGTKLPAAPTKCPKCGTPLPLPKAPAPSRTPPEGE